MKKIKENLDIQIEPVEEEKKNNKVDILVENTRTNLAVRAEPSKDSELLSIMNGGVFSITEIKNGYGKMYKGWVQMLAVKELRRN